MLIDWQLVGPAPPGVDVAWYLLSIGHRVSLARDVTLVRYRDRLAARLGPRFDEAWWKPQMELSLLGQLVRSGWDSAWDVVHHPIADVRQRRQEGLVWMSEQARTAAQHL